MQSKTFEFGSITQSDTTFTFEYKISGGETFTFRETLEFDDAFDTSSIPATLLQTTLETLQLVLGINYWKLYCPETIKLQTIKLNQAQAEYWNTIYTKGLGEFYYRNNIDYRKLVQFPHLEDVKTQAVAYPRESRALVGIGGGKDSIVVGELLKKAEKPFDAFVVETQKHHHTIDEVIEVMHVGTVRVKRTLDPLLFELNHRDDTYNGHVPVSAMYAAIGVLTAILYDYSYFIVGNERSANYGNVNYLGTEVNHQWSKSLEFETMFQEYVRTYITPDITYFSLLRPLSELKITQLFAQYPQYFQVFTSCNKHYVLQDDNPVMWCGHCPKCAFVFAMLAAFLSKDELISLFGKNLFADDELLPMYQELLGIEGFKPFECVGTPDEVKAAFYLTYQKGEYNSDVIMRYFMNTISTTLENPDQLVADALALTPVETIPESMLAVVEKV
ncbi:MAG: hypothetical protein ACEQSA_03230 [Weeksellaceae bacterium]